jgi:hypothetical protein
LAHYAQISTQTDIGCPVPANLGVVFDMFVVDTTLVHDGLTIETAGAQWRLLAIFSAEQPLKKNIHSQGSEPWRQRHARLSRELRDQAYLLTPPASSTVM